MSLGKIGQVKMCKRVLKEQTSENEKIPFYKISTFGEEANTFISNELFLEFKEKYSYPNKGDILISAAGTVGKTVIFDGKPSYFQDSNIVWIENNEKIILNRFLYYFYQTKPWQTTNGSTITRIYNEDLRSIKLTFPESLSTQQKIASVLSALDDKIELNNRINAELEAMAKTLYDYWFVQFDFPIVTSSGVEKPYKTSGGKMVYNETLKREIPEGWEVKSLYEIADYINGLACQKFRPENENDDYLPVIKIREMNEGKSNNTERARINIPEKNIINDGDVLFAWSASLDVKIWTEGKGALNQHIFKVVSKDFPRSFYYFELLNYLKHFKMMAELRKTTMGHITIDHLKTSYISIPPKNLIEKLDKKLNILIEKIIINLKQNQELSTLRDWLLPMLMNGQVKVGE